MATPAKQQKEETITIKAYMHNVTPVQTSKGNNRYFNYTVQYERNEFAGGVSFLLEKRKLFVRAQEEQTPIQLKLVKKLQSK